MNATAAEMILVCRLVGLRSSDIKKEQRAETLLIYSERSQTLQIILNALMHPRDGRSSSFIIIKYCMYVYAY